MMKYENIKNSNELEFAVFCIENAAEKLKRVISCTVTSCRNMKCCIPRAVNISWTTSLM